jgi:hypothetical protein
MAKEIKGIRKLFAHSYRQVCRKKRGDFTRARLVHLTLAFEDFFNETEYF